MLDTLRAQGSVPAPALALPVPEKGPILRKRCRVGSQPLESNPLVCAAAKAALDAILEDGFVLDHCTRMGAYFLERLTELKRVYPDKITDVRGRGLLLGVECIGEVAPAVKACMDRGLLVGSAGNGTVLRFSPPLIVDQREIDQAITIVDEVIDRLP